MFTQALFVHCKKYLSKYNHFEYRQIQLIFFFIRMLVNKPKIIKTISIYFYTLYGFTQLNDHIFLMIISSFFLFFLQC